MPQQVKYVKQIFSVEVVSPKAQFKNFKLSHGRKLGIQFCIFSGLLVHFNLIMILNDLTYF
jgi:hypothetical protein